MLKKYTFLAFKLSNHVFNMVVNVELPAIYDILTFMKIKAFVLRSVEHKSFITSE